MSLRIKPHKVRGRQLEEVREKDPDGRIVVHHRTVDTLGKMLRAGTITQEMHDAAKDLEAAFIVANLDPLRALPVLRTANSTLGAASTRRWRPWAASRARPAHVYGTWSGCSGACASGPSARAGAAGGCGRSRRRESWSRRSGCWRRTSGTVRPSGPKGCLCGLR